MNFLYAASSSGVLSAIADGASREELVESLGVTRPEILDALLDMGTALKELNFKNGRYTLRGKRSKTMASPTGDTLTAIIEANVTYYCDAYRRLGDRMRGAPLGEDLDAIGNVVARFSKIGEPILEPFIRTLVGRGKPVRILDAGCGSGYVLKTAWQANSMVEGIGVDCDADVARQARANLKKWGLPNGFRIQDGDIGAIADSDHDGFDVITAFNLLYYMDPEHQIEFLRKMSAMLAPGGRLAIANNFESKGRDMAAANLNIVNASLTGLSTLPNVETICNRLRQCGFKRVTVTRFMPRSEFFGIVATDGTAHG